MIPATQIKIGQVLKLDGSLFRIMKLQHITPGKGNAVVQAELRNLKTGNKDNRRFRSAESLEVAEVVTRNVSFLYQDGATYHFMDPLSFEQVELNESALKDIVAYLVPETVLILSSYEGNPISVTLPQKMSFEVAECDPPAKGMAGAFKDARLSNGMVVKVPLFIKQGDTVVINTETEEYLEKGGD